MFMQTKYNNPRNLQKQITDFTLKVFKGYHFLKVKIPMTFKG